MKKVFLFVAAAGLLAVTPSCKKGENDPALSLKSRKARLAGEYNVDSWEMNENTVYLDGDKETVMIEIEGDKGTITLTDQPSGESPIERSGTITVNELTYTFEKDGTWSRVIDIETTTVEDGFFDVDRTEVTTKISTTESGTWSFLGGQSEEFKNKERISLSILSSVEKEQETEVIYYTDNTTETDSDPETTTEITYTDGESTETIQIDMLKGKEMTFITDGETEIENNNGGGFIFGYTTTTTGKIELSQE